MKLSQGLDEIAKSAVGVGSSTEGLQAWQFAGKKAGIEADKMTDTLKKTQEIASRNGDAFWQLGIQTRDSRGQMRDTEEIMADLVKTMEGMTSSNRQATLMAMGYTEELVAMNKIMENTDGFASDLETGLDNAISDDTIQQFEAFNDSLEDIKLSLAPVATEIATELLPYLKDFSKWMSYEGVPAMREYLPLIAKFVTENGKLIASLALAGPVLSTFSKLLSSIVRIAPFAKAAFIALGVSGGSALAGSFYLAYTAGNDLYLLLQDFQNLNPKKMFESFGNSAYSTMEAIVISIATMVDSFVNITIDTLNALTSVLNGVITGVNWVADAVSGGNAMDTPTLAKIPRSDFAGKAQEQFTANGYSAQYAQLAGTGYGSVNISKVEVNAKTDLSADNVGAVTYQIVSEMARELQLRGVFE